MEFSSLPDHIHNWYNWLSTLELQKPMIYFYSLLGFVFRL